MFARLTCKDIALKRRDLPQAPSRRQAMCGGTSSRPHRSISHISRWGGPERGGSHGSHLSYRSMGQFDCGLCAQASRRRRCLTGGRADAYHAVACHTRQPRTPAQCPAGGRADTKAYCMAASCGCAQGAPHTGLRSGRALVMQGQSAPPPQRPDSRIQGYVGWTSAGRAADGSPA